jgi:hypothetical protein
MPGQVLVPASTAEDLLRNMRDGAMNVLYGSPVAEVLDDDAEEAIKQEVWEAIGHVLVKHIRTR